MRPQSATGPPKPSVPRRKKYRASFEIGTRARAEWPGISRGRSRRQTRARVHSNTTRVYGICLCLQEVRHAFYRLHSVPGPAAGCRRNRPWQQHPDPSAQMRPIRPKPERTFKVKAHWIGHELSYRPNHIGRRELKRRGSGRYCGSRKTRAFRSHPGAFENYRYLPERNRTSSQMSAITPLLTKGGLRNVCFGSKADILRLFWVEAGVSPSPIWSHTKGAAKIFPDV